MRPFILRKSLSTGRLRLLIPLFIGSVVLGFPSARSFAQASGLEISFGQSRDEVTLHWLGKPGEWQAIDESDGDLADGSWSPRVIRKFSQATTELDIDVTLSPGTRLFRARDFDANGDFNYSSGFRLTDHRGVSHDLHYQEERAAVLLIFVDGQALESESLVTQVKSVREDFTDEQVVVWLVNTDPGASRSQIADSRASKELDIPILEDRTQTVGIDISVSTAFESVILDPETNKILFQGALTAEEDGTNLVKSTLEIAVAEQEPTIRLKKSTTRELSIAPRENPTFTGEIAQILQRHCVKCHSDGNIAPFSMVDYQSIVDRAPSIRRAILTQEMPPWHADPEYGHFSNSGALPAADAQKLIRWINQGTIRGEGIDPLADAIANKPVPIDYPSKWPTASGEPDHIITLPKQDLPANGEVDYRYITVTADLPEGKWLRSAVILPGNQAVVHHVLAFDGSLAEFAGGLNGYFAGYVPGTEAISFPEGTGKWLAKGQEITFQMHYITTGTKETDETKIGFYFHDAEPERELKTEAAFSLLINIPPHAIDHEISANREFTTDVLLYELNPHMHYRGARFKYVARYPDGTEETLLNVPKYWFDWQRPYRFAEPKRLPKGTEIFCVGAFDNSHFNHENPNPSARVRFGEQTDDEMFIGYYHYAEQ